MIQAKIIIPAGRPPVELTPSLIPPEGESKDMDLYAAMENGEDTGLTDGSGALSKEIGGTSAASKGSRRGKVSPKDGWKPSHFSDEDLKSWAKGCRDVHDGQLQVSALKYWLRYTFHSYTPEYKELGERLVKALPQDG
jgi:hypothetical protein